MVIEKGRVLGELIVFDDGDFMFDNGSRDLRLRFLDLDLWCLRSHLLFICIFVAFLPRLLEHQLLPVDQSPLLQWGRALVVLWPFLA